MGIFSSIWGKRSQESDAFAPEPKGKSHMPERENRLGSPRAAANLSVEGNELEPYTS